MLLLISPPVLVLGSCCCLLFLCRCLLGTPKDKSARKLSPCRLWSPLHLSMLGDKVQLWMAALCPLHSNYPFCRGYGIALFSGNSNDRAYSCNSWFMLASTMLEQLQPRTKLLRHFNAIFNFAPCNLRVQKEQIRPPPHPWCNVVLA